MSGRLEGYTRPSVVAAARPIAIGYTRRAAWSPDYAVQWDQVSVSGPAEVSRLETDPGTFVYEENRREVTHSSRSGGASRWTDTVGASVSVLGMFEGPALRRIGLSRSAPGIVAVFIARLLIDMDHQYAAQAQNQQVLVEATGLGGGTHALTIVNTADEVDASSAAHTEIEAIEATAADGA